MKSNHYKLIVFSFLVICATRLQTNAQAIILPDSISVRILASYDSVGKFHRNIFGENYRKDYSLPTTVPIIQLSRIAGGLKAIQRGGG